MSAPRSRKWFRWMDAPVLSHTVARAAARGAAEPSASALAGSFGRGLYLRKLPSAAGEPDESKMRALTVLRWQAPFQYLVIWQRRGWALTWHAPWCRHCDCAGAGWRFAKDESYLAGLGFELTSPWRRRPTD